MKFRYFCVRFVLIFPTLIAVLTLNALILHFTPGSAASAEIAKAQAVAAAHGGSLTPHDILAIRRADADDSGSVVGFLHLLVRYSAFDLGRSLVSGRPVVGLIVQKLPVSIALGMTSTFLIYVISVPLGILQALKAGSLLDRAATVVLLAAASLPSFLLALLMIACFGAGGAVSLFPLRGLVSTGFGQLSAIGRISDIAWHLALPVLAMSAGGFASLSLLVRHSISEELGKLYVTALRARGMTERRIALRHLARRAALLLMANLPQTFVAVLFTAAPLIEIIFSLPGLGLLGYRAALDRDTPVLLGTIYLYTLIGLLAHVVGDFFLQMLDPRIDFARLDH